MQAAGTVSGGREGWGYRRGPVIAELLESPAPCLSVLCVFPGQERSKSEPLGTVYLELVAMSVVPSQLLDSLLVLSIMRP